MIDLAGGHIPASFNTLSTATGPEGMCGEHPPQALADHMHALWVGYARDGRLPWSEFDRETRLVYRIETGEAAHEPVMPAAAFLP